MTREESLAMASMLVEAYPRDVHEGTLEAYALHLADLDREQVGRAIRQLVATKKWLPAISEVRQAVAKLTLPEAPATAVAWAQAVDLMARIGSYGTLDNHGSPYVNRALRLCGRWADICQEDMTWLRKRFVDIYDEGVQGAQEHQQITGKPPEWLEQDMRKALPGPDDTYAAALDVMTKGLADHMSTDDAQ